MISTGVFSRYARSLAEVVFERSEEAAVGEDLRLYGEIFRAVPDLLGTFDNPAIPREVRNKILNELLARYPVSNTATNFLRVLLDNNRIRYFHEIIDHYGRVLDERKGIVRARVISAAPLAKTELEGLRERLARTTGRTVKVEVETDPDLLGGLVVRIGSTVYDGSVRRQLSEMKTRLSE